MRDLLATVLTAPTRLLTLSSAQWELLIAQARSAMLEARLACTLEAEGGLERVPEAPRRHLRGALMLAARQRDEVLWEADCIRRALAKIDTPVVLLKGAAYVCAELPPARGRLFADIDIMVARDRLDDVEGALYASGWLASERDAYNDRYYRQWMHELPPMTNVRRGTTLDVHHTITPPTSRFRVDARKLLADLRPVDATGKLFVLSPKDMVLHSAVHLFQEGEFGHGLRDVLDMADLLRLHGATPGFWDELPARADDIGLGEPLYHAITQIERLMPGLVPQAAARAIMRRAPGRIAATGMMWLLARALRPMHPSCDDSATRFARWVLYVRAHHLRMPVHLLVPHLLRKAFMRRFPGDADAAKKPAP